MKPYIGIVVTIGIFLAGYFVQFGVLKAQTEAVKEDVDKVEEKADKSDEKITENEKIDIEQTVALQYIQQTLESLNRKIDKELKE